MQGRRSLVSASPVAVAALALMAAVLIVGSHGEVNAQQQMGQQGKRFYTVRDSDEDVSLFNLKVGL